MSKNILWILLALCIQATFAQAMPCHCFPTRTFDPAKPAAADSYFLATSHNSFMAVVFGQEKKDVVLAKQKPGATAEGLWIAHWLSQKTGKEAGELLKAQRNASSWQSAISSLRIDQRKLPQQFMAILNGGGNETVLSSFIVDSLLSDKGLASNGELAILRRDGATDQETILASILARKTGQKGSQILGMARKNESWGKLLQKAGLDGGKMVDEIRELLKEAKGNT